MSKETEQQPIATPLSDIYGEDQVVNKFKDKNFKNLDWYEESTWFAAFFGLLAKAGKGILNSYKNWKAKSEGKLALHKDSWVINLLSKKIALQTEDRLRNIAKIKGKDAKIIELKALLKNIKDLKTEQYNDLRYKTYTEKEKNAGFDESEQLIYERDQEAFEDAINLIDKIINDLSRVNLDDNNLEAMTISRATRAFSPVVPDHSLKTSRQPMKIQVKF